MKSPESNTTQLEVLTSMHKHGVPVMPRKSTACVDMRGTPIAVNDVVLRGILYGSGAAIEWCTVTRIAGGRCYLDYDPRPIKYPGRVLVANALFVNTGAE